MHTTDDRHVTPPGPTRPQAVAQAHAQATAHSHTRGHAPPHEPSRQGTHATRDSHGDSISDTSVTTDATHVATHNLCRGPHTRHTVTETYNQPKIREWRERRGGPADPHDLPARRRPAARRITRPRHRPTPAGRACATAVTQPSPWPSHSCAQFGSASTPRRTPRRATRAK